MSKEKVTKEKVTKEKVTEKFLCWVCNNYIKLDLEKDEYECPTCGYESLIPEKVVKGIKDNRIG